VILHIQVILSGGKDAQEMGFVCSITTPPHTSSSPCRTRLCAAQEGMYQHERVGQRQGGMHVTSFLPPKLESRRCLHIQETFF